MLRKRWWTVRLWLKPSGSKFTDVQARTSGGAIHEAKKQHYAYSIIGVKAAEAWNA
jgi:hypothetical protein